MAEADVISKGSPDGFAHRVEIGGVDCGDAAALLAAEVLAAAIAGEGIEPEAVAEVDVADEAELLDALEVAVDQGEVEGGEPAAEAVGDLLGRGRGVGGDQRAEHGPRRGDNTVAGAPQRRPTSSMLSKTSGSRWGASVIAVGEGA